MIQYFTQVSSLPLNSNQKRIFYQPLVPQYPQSQTTYYNQKIFYTPRITSTQPQQNIPVRNPIPSNTAPYYSFQPQFSNSTVMQSTSQIQNNIKTSFVRNDTQKAVVIAWKTQTSHVIVNPNQIVVSPKVKEKKSKKSKKSKKNKKKDKPINPNPMNIPLDSIDVSSNRNSTNKNSTSVQQTPNQNIITTRSRFLQKQETNISLASPFVPSKCLKIEPINFSQLLLNEAAGRNSTIQKVQETPKESKSRSSSSLDTLQEVQNGNKNPNSLQSKNRMFVRQSSQFHAISQPN